VTQRIVFAAAVLLVLAALSATALAARHGGRIDDLVISTSKPVYAEPPGSDTVGRATRSVESPLVADPGWVSRTARRAGIPATAVRAYANATLRTAAEDPSCGLGWTTLAGIGYVESLHGTIGGRLLDSDGRSDPPILGPTLDGAGAVAAVPGVGGWDHAEGPLQFIASTWATWGSDGDGDGAADPNDLDDAAWSAARYLCAGGPVTGTRWGLAVFSYNHSDDYVRQVYDAASAYATRTA